MSEKIDTLTPLGRRVLDEIKAKEIGEPGWIAPGGRYMLADPVNLGWVAVSRQLELFPNLELGEA